MEIRAGIRVAMRIPAWMRDPGVDEGGDEDEGSGRG